MIEYIKFWMAKGIAGVLGFLAIVCILFAVYGIFMGLATMYDLIKNRRWRTK